MSYLCFLTGAHHHVLVIPFFMLVLFFILLVRSFRQRGKLQAAGLPVKAWQQDRQVRIKGKGR